MFSVNIIRPEKNSHWRKMYSLYRKAFPRTERKPFSIIRKMYESGKADVWYCIKENEFIGFATTINSEETVLIDYFAVGSKHRGQGFGSKMLQMIFGKYKGKAVFVEIESEYEQCRDSDKRKKRKSFYIKNGMKQMDVMADVFGVRMELLGVNCKMSFDEYKAFYRDNYSKWASEHIIEAKHPNEEIFNQSCRG